MNRQSIPTKKLTLFALTWPIFIEILLHMLMGNADTLMLSQYSDESVAAVGVANQILFIVIVILSFVVTGTTILISQFLGAKKEQEAANVATLSVGLNALVGIVLSLIFVFFSSYFLRAMNLPEELMEEGLVYIRLVGGFTILQSLIFTFTAILKSYGFTRDVMYITMGMNAINVIGNYLFIFGPFGLPILGVEGVAISTVASRFLGLLVVIYYFYRKLSIKLSLANMFAFKKNNGHEIIKIGIPSAGEHLSYNTSQICITFFIAMLGTQVITTKIYTQNIMMLIFLFALALSQGTQILIGRKIGAQQIEEAYQLGIKTLKMALLISLSLASIFYLISEPLFSIFTSNTDIIQQGTLLLLLTIILEPGRTFNLVIGSALRATGDTRFPAIIGIASMWGLSVPLAYFFGIYLGYGLPGIWVAFILDEWIRGIIMLLRWRSRVWVKMSFIKNEKVESLTAS